MFQDNYIDVSLYNYVVIGTLK